jgi:LPS export ABC transporter protein LptC
MFRKIIYSAVILFLIFSSARAEPALESDQQISEFSLSGYGDKGKKAWDISGKTADIFNDTVKLQDVVGNLYEKEEDVKLTADKGDFNKKDGKVALEDNVVIVTSSGTQLTTDSLDWDRKAHLVSTPDNVNIKKDNLVAVASGASANTDLKKVALEKEVKVDILPPPNEAGEHNDNGVKITITCDGPLEIDYASNIAVFNNNVRVEKEDLVILSDKMNVFLKTEKPVDEKNNQEPMASRIEKIVALGNVQIIRGENISYSQEAVYTALDKRIVLNGAPRLVISSTEGLNDASFGN